MEYLLGMDGGGTATKICVADREGCVIARYTAGPLNINGQAPEQFQETMAEILKWVRDAGFLPEHCGGIGIGAAGSSNPLIKRLLTEAFEAGGYRAEVCTYSDGETALASVFEECHGIVLIAGTGSICLGRRKSGEVIRTGGYGHLIDDGGSAYAMAIAMLSAVVKGADGRGDSTALRRLVMEKLEIDNLQELVRYLYAPSRSKKDIAALAVLVEQAAKEGDGVAMEIEQRSAEELNLMVRTVMKKMPEENHIALAGSVLLKNRIVQNLVIRHILEQRKDACILPVTQDASEGAIRLLKNELC